MARGFANIPTSPYIGTLFSQPAKVTKNRFGNQRAFPPTMVVCNLPWIIYGASTANPNVGAQISIPNQEVTGLIDRILSVRIDNLGNPVPVYVYFPDTAYTVVCPPNSVTWEPVETGQYSAYIYGEGFTTGQVGDTLVYFCNFQVSPILIAELSQSVELWKASATISRGNTIYNQNFGTPALGDQAISFLSGVNATGAFRNNLFLTPQTSGFIYLTHISVSVISAGAIQGFVTWNLQSTGISGTLYTFDISIPPTGLSVSVNLLQLSAMNIKLDASQTWQLSCSAIPPGQGIFLFHAFNWTNNPT